MAEGNLDEIIWHPVQSHLENLQWWGLYHTPGDAAPANNCSHRKKKKFLDLQQGIESNQQLHSWVNNTCN